MCKTFLLDLDSIIRCAAEKRCRRLPYLDRNPAQARKALRVGRDCDQSQYLFSNVIIITSSLIIFHTIEGCTMSRASIQQDSERKRKVIDTLYHHSDLSIEAISNQVDMTVSQVQKELDTIRRAEATGVLTEQSRTPVGKIMTRDVATMENSKSVYDASVLMAKKDVGCLVVTSHDRPFGMVTERDIVRVIPGTDISLKNITLEEFASRPLISASPNETVDEVAQMMATEKIRRIPVLEDGRIGGIVAVTDLARFLCPTRRPGLAESILRAMSREDGPWPD